jgi:hypothetical protein
MVIGREVHETHIAGPRREYRMRYRPHHFSRDPGGFAGSYAVGFIRESTNSLYNGLACAGVSLLSSGTLALIRHSGQRLE